MGGSSAQPESTVKLSGVVIDSNGNPVPGATVTIESGPIVVTTDQSGNFSADVPAGKYAITISKGTSTFYQNTFTAVEGSSISLGNLSPTSLYYVDGNGGRRPGGGGDTQAPTVPGNVTTTTASSSQINLNWSASTDNVGVTEYNVYRGGVFLKHVTGTSTSDTGLTASTQYCYTVNAGDAAGNGSAQSTKSCAITSTPPLTVKSSSPVNGATNVNPLTLIQATFNNTIDSSTVIPSTFIVSMGTQGVSGSLSCSGATVSFSPSKVLTNGALYKVNVKSGASGIKDVSSNNLNSDYTWSFTIVPDSTATLLMQFMNSPTKANYTTLMNAINALGNSQEAYLYKALGELVDIYNSPAALQILTDFGLPQIGFNTDFQQLKTQFNLNLLAYNFLISPNNYYINDPQAFLSETENRLNQVDTYLQQANSINVGISFGFLNTVYFDSIDINVLRAVTNLCKAAFIYLEAVNLTISNYMVTYNGSSVDIRQLITNQITRLPNDSDQMNAALVQLLTNNPSLLTYSDTSVLSKSFYNTLQTASQCYSSAVTSIQGLTPDQVRSRFDNAFGLDSDYQLDLAELIRDQTLPSLFTCITDSTGQSQIIIISSEKIGAGTYCESGDGLNYPQNFYNIFLNYYSFSGPITFYSLFGTGADTPRDVALAIISANNSNTTYHPYVLYSSTMQYQNVDLIKWNEPLN